MSTTLAFFIICSIVIGLIVLQIKRACWHKNISVDDTALIERLLAKGVDINKKDGDITLLMKASSEGCIKTVKLLIEKGADINARTDEGSSALMLATVAQNAKIVELLIDAGAYAKATDKKGWSAEKYAYESGNKRIIHMLNKV